MFGFFRLFEALILNKNLRHFGKDNNLRNKLSAGRVIWIFMLRKTFNFFRSRKKFSTTYAIVFFFSPPFHENFKFLKNCPYDFHEILHSHSTPKGAPACAKPSKSYGWVSGGFPKNCSEGWVGPLSRDRGRS